MTRTSRGSARGVLSAGLALSLALLGCGDPPTATRPSPPDTAPDPPPPGQISFDVEYATYVGGSGFEEGREPVLVGGDRLLFGVRTFSGDLSTTPGAFQTAFAGGDGDTWIAILAPGGGSLEAATYLGGSGMERPPYGMAVSADGDIVVTSGTNSPDLPTTPEAYRRELDSPVNGGYVCRLSSDLTMRRWCTYTLGWPRGGLALDEDGNAIVVGRVLDGAPFSPTSGAFQTEKRGRDDAFVLELTAGGTEAVFKTRLGGNGGNIGEVATSVKVLSDAIVLGGISQSSDFPTTPDGIHRSSSGPRDAFAARLARDGSELLYSTLLGGNDQDLTEHRDALLSDGSLVIGGETFSSDLAGASGSLDGPSDGFIARLSPSGDVFDFVRYVGGSREDRIIDKTSGPEGRVVAVGETTSRDFPVTEEALQDSFGGGESDGFLVLLDGAGEIVYGTYLGGNGAELIRGVTVGPDGAIYLVGLTTSADFPVTGGAFQTTRGGAEDAFAVKLVPGS